MVDVFEDAVSVSIHDKDVRSIITVDGVVIWEKPSDRSTILVFGGSSVSFGQNIVSNGDVIVDWGDGTKQTINNPTENIDHTYNDGETSHTVILNGDIRSFGDNCFKGCKWLLAIEIPNTVTNLGESCFENCTRLSSVVIPDGVITLGDNCFWWCNGLTSVTIPTSVTTIGQHCFHYCSVLVNYELYWISDSIITYDSNKMPNNTNTIFTIPYGSTNDYIAKGYPSDKLVERSE